MYLWEEKDLAFSVLSQNESVFTDQNSEPINRVNVILKSSDSAILVWITFTVT